jgi:hypothetical protein
MSQTYERALKIWVDEFRDQLSPDILRLISLANFDLKFGPYYGDDDPNSEWYQYPGFEAACEKIHEALEEMPKRLWINSDTDEVSTTEPEYTHDCDDCFGSGNYSFPDKNVITSAPCETCDGDGFIELMDEWWETDHATMLNTLVGKSLAEYI